MNRSLWMVLAVVACSSPSETPNGTGGNTNNTAGSGGNSFAGASGAATSAAGTAGLTGGGAGNAGTSGNGGTGGTVSTGGGGTTHGGAGNGGAINAGAANAGANDAGAANAGAAGSTAGTGGVSAAGRMNLALNQPATASSVEQGDHGPERINDGDLVTRWVGVMAVYPQWNQIDLQTPHNIDTVLVWPYMMRAYHFTLEGSLDGVTYFTLSDQETNTVGADTIGVSFPAQNTRYVRITIDGATNYDIGWSAINELEIYEVP